MHGHHRNADAFQRSRHVTDRARIGKIEITSRFLRDMVYFFHGKRGSVSGGYIINPLQVRFHPKALRYAAYRACHDLIFGGDCVDFTDEGF